MKSSILLLLLAVTDKFTQFLGQRSFQREMDLANNSEDRDRTLALERETGWDVSPAIEGKITFADLKAFRDTGDVIKELTARNALPPGQPNFRDLRNALKEHERKRLREMEEHRGVNDKEIDQMVKHFQVLCESPVFAFVNEE